ncbi:MAG: DUF4350 domain-containing protein [Lysobacterales bacterium]
MRSLREAVVWMVLLTILVALFACSWLVTARRDLTLGTRAELSDASRAALAAMPGPLEVIAHLPESSPLREPVAKFVERYRRARPTLRLGFDTRQASGDLEIRYGKRTQRLTKLDERSFTAALLQLARSGERLIGFTVGHGERRFDGEANHDLGKFAEALTARGDKLIAVSLGAPVPAGLSMLVLASPSTALLPAEVAYVQRHVDEGGALLWLQEPDAPVAEALLDAMGLLRLPGTVADAAGKTLKLPDLRFVTVETYPEHPISKEFSTITLFPQALALAARPNGAFIATPLLRSGAASWNETGADATPVFDPAANELPGPLDLGFALTRLSPSPVRQEQRVVVIGDGDFLANQFLGNGGNRELGLRVFDWLLADDTTLGLDLPGAPDATLVLSKRAAAFISVGWLIAWPLALLLGGAITVARRRRR